MKRLLHTMLLLFVCIVFNASEIKAKETTGTNPHTHAADGKQSILSGGAGIFTFPAGMEDRQDRVQSLFPNLLKSPSGGRIWNADAESGRNSEISSYVYFAEYLIARFEGADIIHPFDYFW